MHVHACGYVPVGEGIHGGWSMETLEALELVLQTVVYLLMWLLRTDSGLWEEQALNHWAIPPAPVT